MQIGLFLYQHITIHDSIWSKNIIILPHHSFHEPFDISNIFMLLCDEMKINFVIP